MALRCRFLVAPKFYCQNEHEGSLVKMRRVQCGSQGFEKEKKKT